MPAELEIFSFLTNIMHKGNWDAGSKQVGTNPSTTVGHLTDDPVIGVVGTSVYIKFKFVEGGAPTVVEARADLTNKKATILRNDMEMDNGRLAVRPIIQFVHAKLSITCIYDENGQAVRYRFDGKIA